MNKDENYYNRVMQELFGMKAEAPEHTKARIREVCANLEEKHKQTTIRLFGSTFSFSSRAAIAAAAVLMFTVFAGTALALGLSHVSLFKTTLGDGTPGNERNRTYYSALGDECLYPLFERSELDEETAESLLGEYVSTIDESYSIGGSTTTLREFVIDENGVGYLSYTVENPGGVTGFIERAENAHVLGVRSEKAAFPSIGCSTDLGEVYSHPFGITLVNDAISTDTSLYLVEVFAVNCPLDSVSELYAELGDRTAVLPTDKTVPTRGMTSDDGEHIISLSPIGMTVECADHSRDECNVSELVIKSGEKEYVVESSALNIENCFFEVSWSVAFGRGWNETAEDVDSCAVSYALGQLVIPDRVTTVTVTAEHEKYETQEYAPYLPDYASLGTQTENPFHFLSEEGVEVYLLTADTLSTCSEAELRQFAAFDRGYASYDDLLSDLGSYDESFSQRDFLMRSYGQLSFEDGMTTPEEAVRLYLEVLDKYFPGQRELVKGLAMTLCDGENGPVWWIFRSGVECMLDAHISAKTGEWVSPGIVGLNM